jgi:hypothetical protein
MAAVNHDDPSTARYPEGIPVRLAGAKREDSEQLLDDNITPVIRPKLDDEILKAVEQELNSKRLQVR